MRTDREGDVVLVELAEPVIQLEVIEHVVHPAHVPLEVESQAAHGGGHGHQGPGGGFLGDGQGAREVVEQHRIGLLQEANGLEVFAAAMLIGDPFAIGA